MEGIAAMRRWYALLPPAAHARGRHLKKRRLTLDGEAVPDVGLRLSGGCVFAGGILGRYSRWYRAVAAGLVDVIANVHLSGNEWLGFSISVI
jgi:hypothetical protein